MCDHRSELAQKMVKIIKFSKHRGESSNIQSLLIEQTFLSCESQNKVQALKNRIRQIPYSPNLVWDRHSNINVGAVGRVLIKNKLLECLEKASQRTQHLTQVEKAKKCKTDKWVSKGRGTEHERAWLWGKREIQCDWSLDFVSVIYEKCSWRRRLISGCESREWKPIEIFQQDDGMSLLVLGERYLR